MCIKVAFAILFNVNVIIYLISLEDNDSFIGKAQYLLYSKTRVIGCIVSFLNSLNIS